jgi:hypothetical protein
MFFPVFAGFIPNVAGVPDVDGFLAVATIDSQRILASLFYL